MPAENEDKGHARCGAAARQTGKPCTQAAGWGTDHPGIGRCKLHGGSTPAQQTKARRDLAAQEVTRLGLAVATTPAAALSDALNRAYGDVLATSAKVQLLDEDGWKQRDAGGKFERPSIWLGLYWDALDRYARLADRCTALGIEAAAVSVVQAHGDQVIRLIRHLLASLGIDPAEQRVIEAVSSAIALVGGEETR